MLCRAAVNLVIQIDSCVVLACFHHQNSHGPVQRQEYSQCRVWAHIENHGAAGNGDLMGALGQVPEGCRRFRGGARLTGGSPVDGDILSSAIARNATGAAGIDHRGRLDVFGGNLPHKPRGRPRVNLPFGLEFRSPSSHPNGVATRCESRGRELPIPQIARISPINAYAAAFEIRIDVQSRRQRGKCQRQVHFALRRQRPSEARSIASYPSLLALSV